MQLPFVLHAFWPIVLIELLLLNERVLTNTTHNVKMRDIMTYKDKCNNGEWWLVGYVAVKHGYLPRFDKTRALRGLDSLINKQTII